jgi:hypothetical protein
MKKMRTEELLRGFSLPLMSDGEPALEITDEESVTQIQSDNGPADQTTYRKAVNQIRKNIQE